MENDIIHLINSRLNNLGVFSLRGGVLEVLNFQDGETVRRVPAFNTPDGYLHLTPNENETGICFYRIGNNVESNAARNARVVTMTLVCWVNNGARGNMNSVVVPQAIVSHIENGNYSEHNTIARMRLTDTRIVSMEAAKSEWSGFDLSEQETQYLMSPYHVFAVEFSVLAIVRPCSAINQSMSLC